MPALNGAVTLGLLHQLEQSQWLSATQLEASQFRQIELLLRHAQATVPYYARLGQAGNRWWSTPEGFRELPILTRRDVQGHFHELVSTACPESHGPGSEHRSSGSTGTPVRVVKTGLNALVWNAITLRDHAWHRRDLGATLAAVRHGVREGTHANWGAATEGLIATGPSHVRGVKESIASLWRWLDGIRPAYLLVYPSIVAELARIARLEGRALPGLQEVRTFGELLSPETRLECGAAFGVPVTDAYSAEETGYIALQCPGREHYHVQSEALYVELLREDGTPCAPGEIGRVVITDLLNFAMPLIRYEVGDYAEAGGPCPCGRGLPVLTRILGRSRNVLVTRSGERYWPAFGSRSLAGIPSIVQHQMAQVAIDHIEARLVARAPLSSQEEERLRTLVLSRIPPGFTVSIDYRDEIPRSPHGKYEDFVSLVDGRTSQ